MADTLRTRIAAALRDIRGDLTYEAMADAVIRELGLHRQDRTFTTYGNTTPLTMYRYHTNWRTTGTDTEVTNPPR